jgi:mannose-6-phosphate isomerase-like protein (cupin superfamily)
MTSLIHVNPSEEQIGLGEISVRFLLTGADTNGKLSMFEMYVPKGERLRAPTHMNDEYEETIYGIDGVMTWTIDGEPVEVQPGEAVCIPHGATHRFDNFGSVDAKALVVTTPAIMTPDYFHDVVEVLSAATDGPPDFGKIIAVFKEHGMTVATPDKR